MKAAMLRTFHRVSKKKREQCKGKVVPVL